MNGGILPRGGVASGRVCPAACAAGLFIMKLIKKIKEAEGMSLGNTQSYILVTNVAIGPGMLKKPGTQRKP